MADDRYLVPAVVSAAKLLARLAERGTVSQTELARMADISKSTAHNLLLTLEHLGFVRRSQRTLEYCLGPELVSLGRAAAPHNRLIDRAEELALELANVHNVEFTIAQTQGEGAKIIFAALPPRGLYVGAAVGTTLGRFDNALGRCVLAQLPDDEVERLVRAHRFERRTRFSVTDPDKFLDQVRHVRDVGYAAAAGEYIEHINAAAVPIGDGHGKAELFLVAIGFPDQLAKEDLDTLGRSMRRAADAVTDSVGSTWPEQR